MPKKRIMVIGQKETFLIKVLIQKIKEVEDFECVFRSFDISDISKDWEGTDLVTLYISDEAVPSEELFTFLKDRLTDEGKLLIPVGEKADVDLISAKLPADLIYTSFVRPVDNVAFVKTITELFSKVDSGELKKSILIVDDDPNFLTLVREWLKEKYKVSMANSGIQAIKWLGKNKPDLILLDYEMPVTTGAQVLEMLRSEDETKNIPVMFLTGKDDKESVMEVLSLKPQGYFLKTIEKNELIEKLEEFFILHR